MYTVYILYSDAYQKTYVGYTGDLEERILSHNQLGHKGWTIKYRPWRVVFTKEFKTKKEAAAHETFLKTGVGRDWIQANVRMG